MLWTEFLRCQVLGNTLPEKDRKWLLWAEDLSGTAVRGRRGGKHQASHESLALQGSVSADMRIRAG